MKMTVYCPEIRKLALVDSGTIGQNAVRAILLNCKSIDQLYITNREMEESDVLFELAVRCRRVYISIMENHPQENEALFRSTGLKKMRHCRLLKNVSNEMLTVERADFERRNSHSDIALFG